MKNKPSNQEKNWLLKEKYQGTESAAFRADCAQLEAGTPLAYLIGHVPFLNCTIELDSHPLIPRPETEYWVDQAITAIKALSSRRDLELREEQSHIPNFPNPNFEKLDRQTPKSEAKRLTPYLQILDLCAGSGAVGVAVAKTIPEAAVTFAELDPAHVPTIRKNIQSNLSVNRKVGLDEYQVIVGDLFSTIPDTLQFDFILTNPPYIDAEAKTVDANVALHEPHLALFGGAGGMEIIARIITEAPEHLAPSGQLWIEHEPTQVDVITTLATKKRFTIITHHDQYGVPRFSVLTVAQ